MTNELGIEILECMKCGKENDILNGLKRIEIFTNKMRILVLCRKCWMELKDVFEDYIRRWLNDNL